MIFDYSNYGSLNGTVIAQFDILWSIDLTNQIAVSLDLSTKNQLISSNLQQPQHKLDNSNNLNIIIYKCEYLASNCGICLGLNLKKFECGWCDVDSRCTHADDCPRDSGWLTKTYSIDGSTPICPYPRIDNFSPRKGPINGGTKVQKKFFIYIF